MSLISFSQKAWSYEVTEKYFFQGLSKYKKNIFCFFIIYALQNLHMQYQFFPDTITNYIFANNGERSTQPNKLDEI